MKQSLEPLVNGPSIFIFNLNQDFDHDFTSSIQSNNEVYAFSIFDTQFDNAVFNFDSVKVNSMLDMLLGNKGLYFFTDKNEEYDIPSLIDINVVKASESSTLVLENPKLFSLLSNVDDYDRTSHVQSDIFLKI